jgi:hypothetical protein
LRRKIKDYSYRLGEKRHIGLLPGTIAFPFSPKEVCAPSPSNPPLFFIRGCVASKRAKVKLLFEGVDMLQTKDTTHLKIKMGL